MAPHISGALTLAQRAAVSTHQVPPPLSLSMYWHFRHFSSLLSGLCYVLDVLPLLDASSPLPHLWQQKMSLSNVLWGSQSSQAENHCCHPELLFRSYRWENVSRPQLHNQDGNPRIWTKLLLLSSSPLDRWGHSSTESFHHLLKVTQLSKRCRASTGR